MRLQGMVGDSVTIRPAGSGWRPPDWITNPEVALDLPAAEDSRAPERAPISSGGDDAPAAQSQKPQDFHPQYDGGGGPEGTTRFRRAVFRGAGDRTGVDGVERWRREASGADDYDVEAGAPRAEYVADRARRSFPRRKAVIEKHQQHLRRGAQRMSRHRLTFWQQICAILLSIFVGLSLLGMIATLLSTKLDDLETKLETRTANKLYPDSSDRAMNSGIRVPAAGVVGTQGKHHQRVLNGIESVAAVHLEDHKTKEDIGIKKPVPSFSLISSIQAILHAASSFARVRSLVADETEMPKTTASVMVGAIGSAMNRMVGRRQLSAQMPPSQYSLGPSATEEQVQAVSATLQLELQKLIAQIMDSHLTGAVPQPIQIPQAFDKAQSPLLRPQPSTSSLSNSPIPNALPVAKPFGSLPRAPRENTAAEPQKASTSLFPENAPVQAGDATHLVSKGVKPENIGTVTNALVPTHTGADLPSINRDKNERIAQNWPMNSIPPEAVEMWTLPSGKNICRFFRVCRMQDGAVLLPQWMKRHADVLRDSCGLKKAKFLLENTQPSVTDGSQFTVRHQRKEFPDGLQMSLEHAGRDAFGHTAPRDHMPHFVSDSFKSLASIEALLGSGKGKEASAVITPETGGAAPTKNVPAFSSFLPTLQLYEGTLNRNTTDWVPSLAQMYKSIGFEFASAGMEKPDENESSKIPMTGSCFRSMIMNNLKQYEPHGMFDPSGQNVLFTSNKLSRNDAAGIPATKAKPCSVTVTALTRPGPRALLKLPELDKTLSKMGHKLGINTIFRTVDFKEGVPFAEQVRIMQTSNVLIATHGAGNANFMFMRPNAGVIEIFPFSYRAGPFNEFARIFGLDYRYSMSEPQTDVFKECMNRHEKKDMIKSYAFDKWDEAVAMDKKEPGVHRLQFETEFGIPGQSEGMTTRQCVRMQELEFNIPHVASMAMEMARQQCQRAQAL